MIHNHFRCSSSQEELKVHTTFSNTILDLPSQRRRKEKEEEVGGSVWLHHRQTNSPLRKLFTSERPDMIGQPYGARNVLSYSV